MKRVIATGLAFGVCSFLATVAFAWVKGYGVDLEVHLTMAACAAVIGAALAPYGGERG